MKAVCLHNKAEIEAFLRRTPLLHLYELGDLDPFFWPYTTWYALKSGPQVEQLCLLYSGANPPVLLGLAPEPLAGLYDLLRAVLPLLPRRFYAHLSGGVANVLAGGYQVYSLGRHDKMTLSDPARLAAVATAAVVSLSPADTGDLAALYAAGYPGNWFDPRMLETGLYFGLRHGGCLVSAAGIHTYSPQYGVAVLGNIVTHPDYRGRGLGAAVTARLCQSLIKTVEYIGLNVKASNRAAIRCYEKLGFTRNDGYEEYLLEIKCDEPK